MLTVLLTRFPCQSGGFFVGCSIRQSLIYFLENISFASSIAILLPIEE